MIKKNKVNKQWFQDKIAERGLSQARFAKKVGIDPSQVSYLLTGKRKMTLPYIEMFADNLGLPIDDVLSAAGLEPSTKTTGVPLVGIVNDFGEIKKSKDKTISISVVVPFNVSAIQVQAPSSFMDGWILLYSNDIKSQPVSERKLCVVNDERLGILKRGYNDNNHNILFGEHQTQINPVTTKPITLIVP